jgi:hypothetical protein
MPGRKIFFPCALLLSALMLGAQQPFSRGP